MESTDRDRLRRETRRVVHQTYLRHFERDPMGTPARKDYDLSRIRAECSASLITDEELNHWIDEDEHEFQRALLISDLVARRVGTRTEPAPAKAPVTVEPLPAAPPRPARTEPSIADLLDDMFAQRKPAPSR